MAQTAAFVNILASNNATLQDAFTFGTAGDTSWDFAGQNFIMEVKASRDDVAPLLTLQSTDSTIIIDSVPLRTLHLQLAATPLRAALPVGEYVYDLVMYDGATPPVRVQLMQGRFCLTQGVTEN